MLSGKAKCSMGLEKNKRAKAKTKRTLNPKKKGLGQTRWVRVLRHGRCARVEWMPPIPLGQRASTPRADE